MSKKKNKNKNEFFKIDGEQVYLLTISGSRHEDHIPVMFCTADRLFKEYGICLSHLSKESMDELNNGEWLFSSNNEFEGWGYETPWDNEKEDVANEMMKAWKEGKQEGLIAYFLKKRASSGMSEEELEDLAGDIENELFWNNPNFGVELNIIAVRVGDISVT